MADAMQNLVSVYQDICEKIDIDIDVVFDEIEVKNKKWREKAPLYTKNIANKSYEVSPYGRLQMCENLQNKRIGSSWCLHKCGHATNIDLDSDPHGRLDSIKFTCTYGQPRI